MADDPITLRLQVAQQLIGRCLHDLRQLTDVLGLLTVEAHDREVVSDDSFEVIHPALKELDTLLTRALELFPPEGG